MKTSIGVLEPQARHVVRSLAILLCCLSVSVFTVPSRAQISPFFNRSEGNLNGEDVNDMNAAGQRLYGEEVVPKPAEPEPMRLM
jgi:hypothetical protein